MLLGNLTSILLTIVALLQALSWTIAGLLILATLSITTLLPLGNTASSSRLQTKKPTNHPVPAKPEHKPFPKHEPPKTPSQIKSEFQKAMIPKITPPKTIPEAVSPARSIPMKPNAPNQAMLKPIPPKTILAIPLPPKPVPSEPELGKLIVVARGDYVSYDLQLDQGKSITCDVTANGRVNFYLLDEDNLTSLDLGEEFWSETGEENTEKATLDFKARQTGKWFLVVENTESGDVTATVNVRKASPKNGPTT